MKARLVLVALVAIAVAYVIWRGRGQSHLRPTGTTQEPSATIDTGIVASTSTVPSSPSAEARTTARITATPQTSASSSPQVAVNKARSTPSVTAATEMPSGAAPATAPQTAMEALRVSIRLYGSMFDGNPVGTNLEITRALNGNNPKHVRFLDDARVNAKGELIDAWGTPYFFHQLSGHETEIRSAGPDKQMWTADDLVIR